MTAWDATTLSDEEVLAEVRTECARWEANDDAEASSSRLLHVRDEALRRGLPLPMSCPLDSPSTADGAEEAGRSG